MLKMDWRHDSRLPAKDRSLCYSGKKKWSNWRREMGLSRWRWMGRERGVGEGRRPCYSTTPMRSNALVLLR